MCTAPPSFGKQQKIWIIHTTQNTEKTQGTLGVKKTLSPGVQATLKIARSTSYEQMTIKEMAGEPMIETEGGNHTKHAQWVLYDGLHDVPTHLL